jgi:hypothetical protein
MHVVIPLGSHNTFYVYEGGGIKVRQKLGEHFGKIKIGYLKCGNEMSQNTIEDLEQEVGV